MRVSEYYRLNLSQGDLDFVDVDVTNDVRLFIDPVALRVTPTPFANECVVLLQDFFQEVLDAIGQGQSDRLTQLMGVLGEPDETHLGLSTGASKGRGVGTQRAADIWQALTTSDAAKSGLLLDLEDTALLVEGIGPDLISDLCTHIIKEPLLRYTESMSTRYGIPLSQGVDSGFYWDLERRTWASRFCSLPTPNNRKIVLVPKSIVRKDPGFLPGEYYDDYILTHLESLQISSGGALVRTLKNGRQKVYRKDLRAHYGQRKSDIVKLTSNYPAVMAQYRAAKRMAASEPLRHDQLHAEVDWPTRIQRMRAAPGTDSETLAALQAVLVPLTYPSLSSSEPCAPSRGWTGLLLSAVNQARGGFFRWARSLSRAPNAVVAVSSRSNEEVLEELRALHAVLERERIRLGVLALHADQVDAAVLDVCRAIYRADRCLIVPLGMSDLEEMIKDASLQEFALMQTRADQIISADSGVATGEGMTGAVAELPIETTLGLHHAVVLLVTALPLETRAVKSFLTGIGERIIAGYPCISGQLAHGGLTWQAVVLEAGKGNINAALKTGAVAAILRPDIALFVGVAGGRKDTALGDVVVANKVYNYEASKEICGGAKPRPDAFPGSAVLERHARAFFNGDSYAEWAAACGVDLTATRGSLAGLVAPIASGEKVVADVRGSAAGVLDQSYSDAVAVDMEGVGFMQAIHNTARCDATVIRGISDLLNEKEASDADGWQPIAATRAAAVAMWLVLAAPLAELRRE